MCEGKIIYGFYLYSKIRLGFAKYAKLYKLVKTENASMFLQRETSAYPQLKMVKRKKQVKKMKWNGSSRGMNLSQAIQLKMVKRTKEGGRDEVE